MKRGVIVLACMALASGCGGGESNESLPTMHGRLVAPECAGGYELESSQVTLRNQSDEIIGTGTTSTNLVSPLTTPCVVSFTIKDVPAAKFYSIKIGSHEGPAWSPSQLKAQSYNPDLGLDGTSVPQADPEALCASATDLHALLLDVDTLNDDSDKWDTQVHGYAVTLDDYAAGLLVDGREGARDDANFAIDAAAALKAVHGYVTADKLNNQLSPLNVAMQGLSIGAHCDTWASVSYK